MSAARNSARLPARYMAVLCDILEGLGIERSPLLGAAGVRSIDAPDAFVTLRQVELLLAADERATVEVTASQQVDQDGNQVVVQRLRAANQGPKRVNDIHWLMTLRMLWRIMDSSASVFMDQCVPMFGEMVFTSGRNFYERIKRKSD